MRSLARTLGDRIWSRTSDRRDALLAHYLGERGQDEVRKLLDDPDETTAISALTVYEFLNWLRQSGMSLDDRNSVIREYAGLIDVIVPLSSDVAALAADLRSEASSRISAVDVMIAATAVKLGAVLVHRDAHYAALPPETPVQEVLPENCSPRR